jgi:hypothetical protein
MSSLSVLIMDRLPLRSQTKRSIRVDADGIRCLDKIPGLKNTIDWQSGFRSFFGAFNILTDLANELRGQGSIDERESFIDAMFCAAKGVGRQIGKTKRGKIL